MREKEPSVRSWHPGTFVLFQVLFAGLIVRSNSGLGRKLLHQSDNLLCQVNTAWSHISNCHCAVSVIQTTLSNGILGTTNWNKAVIRASYLLWSSSQVVFMLVSFIRSLRIKCETMHLTHFRVVITILQPVALNGTCWLMIMQAFFQQYNCFVVKRELRKGPMQFILIVSTIDHCHIKSCLSCSMLIEKQSFISHWVACCPCFNPVHALPT